VNSPNLRQGLLEAESRDPGLETRYRQRLLALTERRLTTAARVGHIVGMALALVFVVRFLQLFVEDRAQGRPEALVGLGLGLAFCAGWALAELAVLRAGVERHLSHGTVRTLLLVGFTSLLAGVMLWAGLSTPDPARGMRLILFGLVFWSVIGLPFLISYLAHGSEVRTRIALLKLELRLAEGGEPREVRS
jgi:hypothetical protein